LTLGIQKKSKILEASIPEELERKIESITKSLQKQYFKKSLLNLSQKNIENAKIICNYIIAEQTEINIKDSTKEGKIKNRQIESVIHWVLFFILYLTFIFSS